MTQQRSTRYQPQFEALESRTLTAAYISNGNLVIVGTTGNDRAWVSDSYGTVTVTLNGRQQSFARSQVWTGNAYFFGDSGDDVLDATGLNLRVIGYGGFGNDTFYGGNRNDMLDGGPGRDYLFGGSGNDWLDGGGGNDNLYGGSGNDNLLGRSGNDYLDSGGDGYVDYLYGGYGWDTYSKDSYDKAFDPDQTVR